MKNFTSESLETYRFSHNGKPWFADFRDKLENYLVWRRWTSDRPNGLPKVDYRHRQSVSNLVSLRLQIWIRLTERSRKWKKFMDLEPGLNELQRCGIGFVFRYWIGTIWYEKGWKSEELRVLFWFGFSAFCLGLCTTWNKINIEPQGCGVAFDFAGSVYDKFHLEHGSSSTS